MSARPRSKALGLLLPEETGEVLRTLLKRHPHLAREAEELAKAMISEVDVETIAEDVEDAMLAPDLDDLGARSGRKRWGYVEPREAAWEILEEALEPFAEQMKRHIELGLEAAAVGVCQGIVLGLYRCRDKAPDRVLGWAGGDFPVDSACNSVATLAHESAARRRRAWQLPEDFFASVPEWAGLLQRAARS